MSEALRDNNDIVHVDFHFRRKLAEKIEGNLAGFCYQCGACVGDCPAATYSSKFNPREIMLKVLYGLGEELLLEDSILWQCTNCYNCHERCPQQVKPVEVIISLKNMLADRGIYPNSVQKVIKTFEESGRTVPLNQAVNRQRQRYGLEPLQPVPMEEIQPLIDPSSNQEEMTPRAQRSVAKPAQNGSKRFAFFPGCLIPARFPAMEFAIRHTMSTLGIDIVDLEGTSCCPDPIYFKSKDKVSWLTVAARNLTLAEELGVDIFTNCSGCTATLSEAHHLLEDETLRGKVNERLKKIGREYRGSSRVRHIATLLRDEIGYEAVRDSVVRPLEGLKAAIHYGCHLLKPSRIMQVDDPNNPSMMENLVTALGAKPVRHRNWYLCCGKASQSEEIPDNMMHDLLGSVNEEQADILCLICPTCFSQFDHGQTKVARQFGENFHTPPIYYLQLLAFAQGVPYDKLGLERQLLKPECLRRFESAE
jgi:heterodisulfide reductase subunit B